MSEIVKRYLINPDVLINCDDTPGKFDYMRNEVVLASDYDKLLLKLKTMTNDRDAEKSMKAKAREQREEVSKRLANLQREVDNDKLQRRNKKVRDQNGEVFELDQWWVTELKNASITRPTSADLVRACAVALNLAKATLSENKP